jgi:protein-glutamine gamma-glutamyltransferase
MIYISGTPFDSSSLLNQYSTGSVEYIIVDILSKSERIYRYSSLDELTFEIDLRRKIIDASYALYRSRLAFRIFQEAKCNEDFWNLRDDGGFVLKDGVLPSDAINDIFINTRKYGTECATAIVIIYYKAVLDIYGDSLFNSSFRKIVLMNWQQIDNLLGIRTYRALSDYLPGDCRYFRNPDVNPLTPEWQGENAIDLSGGKYYGHGIGITDADRIIAALNANRAEGSETSAYLMDTATRPDLSGLYRHKAASVQT